LRDCGGAVATVAATEVAGETGTGNLDLEVGIGIDDCGVDGAVATVAEIDMAGDGCT
jgi:hypothetical protein